MSSSVISYYMPKVCIIKQKKSFMGSIKMCVGSTKMCLVITRQILNWAIGQSGKKEADSTKRTHC